MTREFIDGDRVGYDVEGDINQHDAVKLVGPRTVAATDTSDEEVWGIAMNSGSDDPDAERNRVTVVQHGMYTCRVSNSADVNDYLTASTTAGQLRALDEGTEEIQAKLFRALDDVDEDGKMLVYIS